MSTRNPHYTRSKAGKYSESKEKESEDDRIYNYKQIPPRNIHFNVTCMTSNGDTITAKKMYYPYLCDDDDNVYIDFVGDKNKTFSKRMDEVLLNDEITAEIFEFINECEPDLCHEYYSALRDGLSLLKVPVNIEHHEGDICAYSAARDDTKTSLVMIIGHDNKKQVLEYRINTYTINKIQVLNVDINEQRLLKIKDDIGFASNDELTQLVPKEEREKIGNRAAKYKAIAMMNEMIIDKIEKKKKNLSILNSKIYKEKLMTFGCKWTKVMKSENVGLRMSVKVDMEQMEYKNVFKRKMAAKHDLSDWKCNAKTDKLSISTYKATKLLGSNRISIDCNNCTLYAEGLEFVFNKMDKNQASFLELCGHIVSKNKTTGIIKGGLEEKKKRLREKMKRKRDEKKNKNVNENDDQ